jgi:hypothetical protein
VSARETADRVEIRRRKTCIEYPATRSASGRHERLRPSLRPGSDGTPPSPAGPQPKTVANAIVPLREMLQHVVEWNLIAVNPALVRVQPGSKKAPQNARLSVFVVSIWPTFALAWPHIRTSADEFQAPRTRATTRRGCGVHVGDFRSGTRQYGRHRHPVRCGRTRSRVEQARQRRKESAPCGV